MKNRLVTVYWFIGHEGVCRSCQFWQQCFKPFFSCRNMIFEQHEYDILFKTEQIGNILTKKDERNSLLKITFDRNNFNLIQCFSLSF